MGEWLRRRLERLSDEIIAYVVIALIISVITAVRPRLPSVSTSLLSEWPRGLVIFAVFLIAFGWLLFVGNQFAIARARGVFKRLRAKTPAQVEAEIRQWTYGLGYSVARRNVPGQAFVLDIDVRDGPTYEVSMPTNQPLLTIRSSITIDPQIQGRLDAITADPHSTLIFDMRRDLALLGVSHQGFAHPLRQVELVQITPVDESLNWYTFFTQHFYLVRRGTALVIITLEQLRREQGWA
jgi:hypothetical protein